MTKTELSEFRRLNCAICKLCIPDKLYATRETCCNLPFANVKLGTLHCKSLIIAVEGKVKWQD
jgi:hypothetical protein